MTTMANSFPSPIAINPIGSSPTSFKFPADPKHLGWSAPNSGYFHDISNKIPGTVGPIRYWPTNTGSFKGAVDSYIEVDSGVVFNDWQRYVAANYDMGSRVAAYDVLRLAYNTKNAVEKARKNDFFSNLFEAPVADVPVRPCPPTRPAAYAGPTLRTDKTWDQLIHATNGLADRNAGAGMYFHHNPWDNAQGSFLQASTDDAADGVAEGGRTTEWAQHVFGRFGQGLNATVDIVKYDAVCTRTAANGIGTFCPSPKNMDGASSVVASDSAIDNKMTLASGVNKNFVFPAATPFSYVDPGSNGHGVIVSMFP